jgi:hypothetical protein
MAADLTQSFLNKHIEKLVLAAAVAILVAAGVLFVGMRSSRENLRTSLKTRIAAVEEQQKQTTLPDVLNPEEKKQLLETAGATVQQFKEELEGLPPAWDVTRQHTQGAVKVEGPVAVTRNPPRKPDEILPVVDLRMAVGRGVTSDPTVAAAAVAKVPGKPLSDILWAGCVGKFDLTEQLAQYLKADNTETEIIITKVELQRRARKADGQWADWENAAPVIPHAVADKLPKRPANAKDKVAVYNWYKGIREAQATIRRMPFYPLAAMDEGSMRVSDAAGEAHGVEQPRVPTAAPTAPAAPAAPAEAPATPAAGTETPPPPPPATTTPGKPAWATDIPTEEKGPGAKARAEEAHVYATVWASDVAVKPGHAYQYRMRVSLFNPAYAQAEAEEALRWVLEFEGKWSDPTPEEGVLIPELVQFFFVGSFGEKANLELQRWIHGQWVIVRSVPSNVGAPVVCKRNAKLKVPGASDEVPEDVDLSPGFGSGRSVLLVDMVPNFTYYPEGNKTPTKVNVLVYTDAQGRLARRLDWTDRKEAAQARAAREGALPKAPPAAGKAAGGTTARPAAEGE